MAIGRASVGFSVLVSALLFAGGSRGVLVVAADSPTREILGSAGAVEAIRSWARRSDLTFRVIQLKNQQEAQSDTEAAVTGRCRVLVVATVFPVDTAAVARAVPQVRVLDLGGHPAGKIDSSNSAGSVPPNLLVVRRDVRAAFRALGRKAAAAAAVAGGGRVGMVAVRPTPVAEAELEAFTRAYQEASGRDDLVRRRLRSLTDRTAAGRLIREMRAEGVQWFLLKCYGLTAYCLDELRKQGGNALVESAAAAAAFPGVVSMAVADDWRALFDGGGGGEGAEALRFSPHGWQRQAVVLPWKLHGDYGEGDR